jgi:hypothetical protein
MLSQDESPYVERSSQGQAKEGLAASLLQSERIGQSALSTEFGQAEPHTGGYRVARQSAHGLLTILQGHLAENIERALSRDLGPLYVLYSQTLTLAEESLSIGAVSSPARTTVPGAALAKVFEYLRLRWNLSSAESCQVLGFAVGDGVRRDLLLSLGDFQGDLDKGDRIGALLEIYRWVASMYGGNREAERHWLRAPIEDLGGVAPLEMMVRRMEDLLAVRDYVRWQANR